ncbi:MAG TPA: FAD/NAD(P)-binding oxidoreductase [Gemmatimonadaceae bacterium]|nr:FAD/NAD(P)-binding oxidoreductase [Gemmatimonadaceae bacterium]
MSERRTPGVVVVGGGPAGIAAAALAAESGASVRLIDENLTLGGQIWRRDVGRGRTRMAERWMARLARSGARVERAMSVVDATRDADGELDILAVRGSETVRVRAASVVICTGARERFLPFPGWTLPGVLGVGGAQALIKSGMDVRGRRVVVAGSGPLLLAAAAGVARAGGRVVLIAEQATASRVAGYAAGLWRSPTLLLHAGAYRAAIGRGRYTSGRWVARADGADRIERVTVTDGRRETTVPCDLLCTGYGLVPDDRLARLLGCAVDAGAVRVDAVQRTTVPGVYAAGEPTGIGGVAMAIAEGVVAGLAAAGNDEAALRRTTPVRRLRAAATRMELAFALRAELRSLPAPDTILCRCEDVPFGDVALDGGFRRARLHHRVGMGACQGRVCGDALAWLTDWPGESVRPPLVPVPLAALAGATAHLPHDH